MRKLIYLVFMFVSFVANGMSLPGKAEAAQLPDKAVLEESAARAVGYHGPIVFTDAMENSQKNTLLAAHYSHRSHSSHYSHSSHFSSRF